MNDNYRKRSVLNESLQSIRSVFEASIGRIEGLSPQFLFHIQPSMLRDLDLIGLESQRHKSAYYKGAIEIALAVGYLDAKVVAVIINPRDIHASDTAKLMDAWHIESLMADIELNQEDIVSFLSDAWSRRSEYREATKRITNDPEDWFRKICDYATGNILNNSKKALFQELKDRGFNSWKHIRRNRYEIFREVALDRLVEIPANKTRESEFARKTRVDLVITSEKPKLLPFIVFEIDGPFHDTPKAIEKDKLKDSILAEAHIPCMRLALKDLGFYASNRLKKMINLEDEKIKFEFSALLENIIRSVIDGLRHETFEIPNLHEKADEAIAQTLEARIRDYQITNSRIDIPDGDVEQLLLSAEDECIDITMDAKYEEYLLSTEKRPLGTAGLLADELCKNLGNVVTRFEYEIDGDGFSCATCLIEDSHGGQTVFQSPKIRIRMQNLDFPIFGISFDDILKEKLRSNVLRVVYKHLKLDLPLC